MSSIIAGTQHFIIPKKLVWTTLLVRRMYFAELPSEATPNLDLYISFASLRVCPSSSLFSAGRWDFPGNVSIGTPSRTTDRVSFTQTRRASLRPDHAPNDGTRVPNASLIAGHF